MTAAAVPAPGRSNGSDRLVAVLAGLPLALAILTFIGYYAGVPAMISLRPEYRAMSTPTATCILLLALGLIAARRGRERAGAVAGSACLLLAVAVLVSYAAAGQDVFSPWWAVHVFFLPPGPGFTSRSTAVAVACIACSLLARRRPRVADVCAAASLTLATVALLGYAYGAADLYALAIFNNMALNTAVSLFLLSIAVFCIDPDLGWSAIVASRNEIGGATRRQLGFCLISPLVGWMVVHAVRAGWLAIGAGMALFVAGTLLPLAVLILRDGARLSALSAERRLRDAGLASAARRAQEELADQAQRLKQESTERAKVEEAMYRAQRLDAIGQLTGGIAHDFNNLLMVLSGNVQLLKRRMPADDPLRRYVDNMATAVGKGSKVTKQLMAFSRSQRLDIKPTPVEAVVANARQLIGSSLGPLVDVEMRLEAGDACGLCDADQLELALLNLSVNARDAMPDGGKLTIACLRSAMEQAPTPGEPCVLIRVIDTGVGMEAEVAAHAAEPFFTTKDRGKGTGLGLAQVHGFVAQCKGELRIISAPGKGTTIEMRFPLVAATPGTGAVVPPEPPASARARQPLRVIVIDDDDGVRDVIVQSLTEAGYDVVAAVDGKSGLAEMASFRPAAAVIDFIMPGMHGADVARAAQVRYPGLPIIFVSGYADTAALEGVAGAAVLRKPFEMSALTQLVGLAVAA